MRKIVLISFLILLLGVIAFSIQANTARKVTIITVPEGTVTEVQEEVAAEQSSNNEQLNPDSGLVVNVETMEITEGIVTVRTETVGVNLDTQQNDGTSFVSAPEDLQQMHDTFLELRQDVESLKSSEP
jgi:hypothetical protein